MITEAPLCVDLDGTLIKSDLLTESLLLLIKINPLYFFLSLYWLAKGGKAYFKQQVAARVQINPAVLPYNQCLLSYLLAEKAKGRNLILVTAADNQIANQIAAHLGIFSEVIASNGIQNLKGSYKRDVLNKKFGVKKFDYAGNAAEDISVWASSRAAIVVNAKPSIIHRVNKISLIEQIFQREKMNFLTLMKLFRVHQYVKNFLVFVPLILAHLYFNIHDLINSFLAFIIFCCMASSAYMTNDLLDLQDDRQHTEKRKRSFASGSISLHVGLICSPLLLIIACLLSLNLSTYFCLCAMSYFILTLAYSLYFKHVVLADVFFLSILYTIRIIAGIFATKAEFSHWLIAFSVFFFLSLACVKRYSELQDTKIENKSKIAGRMYIVTDLQQMQLFATISGYMSVLVLALYINSKKVYVLYQHPEFLWIVCIVLLYWISRICLLAARGELHGDPLLFAIKDKFSLLSLLIILITIMWSAHFG